MSAATSTPARSVEAASRPAAAAQPWWAFAIEGSLLGGFMLSACGFGVLMFHPRSPVVAAVPSDTLRNALMGLAMALTAIALIYSPWGKRTGPHMNPAVTLCFYRLGALRRRDTLGYVIAQFAGGVIGTALAALVLRGYLSDVSYVATIPGRWGVTAAWIGEFAIAFILMTVVLTANRYPRLAPHTGHLAAALLFLYITFESPISGMSLNPARTLGSAVVGSVWTSLWVYFTAPPLGMLAAVETQRLLARTIHQHFRGCGKLTHSRRVACLFPCRCLEHKHKDAAP